MVDASEGAAAPPSPGAAPGGPGAPGLVLFATLCLSEALLLSQGAWAPGPLALAVLGWLALAGAERAAPGPGPGPDLLLLAALWSLAWYGFHPAAPVLRQPDLAPWLPGLAALGASGLLLAVRQGWLAGGPPALLTLLLLAGLGGGWILTVAHSGHIDVHVLQQEAASGLWRGVDPYARDYPDIYQGRAPFPVFTQAFPYPPLQALLDALVWRLTGDVRWGALAALLTAAGATGALARRARPDPHDPGPLALAVLVAFQPRALMVLERAWTEPWLLAALAGIAWAWAAGRLRLVAVLAGAALGLKQYAVLLLPALLLLRPTRRQVGLAALAAAAPLLPFLLWHPRELWADLFVHVSYEVRPDSLSLAVPLLRLSGLSVPSGLAAALGLAWGALLWRRSRGPALAPALRAAAGALWLTFLVGPKAHLNYYFLVVGLLPLALAATPAGAPAAPTPGRTPGGSG